MFQTIFSFARTVINAALPSEEKVTCYHCGEKSRKSVTVYVRFDSLTRPVCCYGCAAILRTVEELNMQEEYYNSKIANYKPN
jgi:ribosomal protein S27E